MKSSGVVGDFLDIWGASREVVQLLFLCMRGRLFIYLIEECCDEGTKCEDVLRTFGTGGEER